MLRIKKFNILQFDISKSKFIDQKQRNAKMKENKILLSNNYWVNDSIGLSSYTSSTNRSLIFELRQNDPLSSKL